MAPVGYREYSDSVRAGADIVAVVSEVVSLRKSGRSMTGLCPFHQEKTPSFHVDPVKQVYFCFGCRAGGDVFDFVMALHNVAFPDAVRLLGDKLGIAPPAPRNPAEAEADRRRRRVLEALTEAQAFFTARLFGEGGEGARAYLARRGLPEEQGFLRDIEAAACQQFTTVLAPGSNAYHYDHIHVDLMRRAARRLICEPAAVSGEEVAARAARRGPYASREPFVTGSLGGRKAASHRQKHGDKVNEEDEFEDE